MYKKFQSWRRLICGSNSVRIRAFEGFKSQNIQKIIFLNFSQNFQTLPILNAGIFVCSVEVISTYFFTSNLDFSNKKPKSLHPNLQLIQVNGTFRNHVNCELDWYRKFINWAYRWWKKINFKTYNWSLKNCLLIHWGYQNRKSTDQTSSTTFKGFWLPTKVLMQASSSQAVQCTLKLRSQYSCWNRIYASRAPPR